MAADVKPLFPEGRSAVVVDTTADVVRHLRELADQIERGEVTCSGAVYCCFENHLTHIQTRLCGQGTRFHRLTVLDISHAMALKALLDEGVEER